MSAGGSTGGYQLVTPAYYDQCGQLVMGNSRAVPQMVRLMSPATLLMNSATAQHGHSVLLQSSVYFASSSRFLFCTNLHGGYR